MFSIKNNFLSYPTDKTFGEFKGNLNEMNKLPNTFKKYNQSIYV